MSTQPLPLSHTQDPALRAALRGLDELLPPIRYTSREGGEVDYYGAGDLIAAELQMDRPLFTGFKASWAHGWSEQAASIESPRLLVQDDYRKGVNLVDTETSAQFLRGHGYNGVAVGAPFVYADEPTPPVRLSSSVLVFPPHSTAFSSLNATGDTLPYVEQVVKLKARFKTVVASIGGPDVLKGNWIRAFEAAGIPWVCGAWVNDRNGLVRMQRIMRSFEFATTNILGSHVAYAAYCGCRVVFYGDNQELKIDDVLSHPYYRANPALAEHVRDRMFNDAKLRERFPFLFRDFSDAPDLTAWGREQLGAANRKPAREIAAHFGWDLQPHSSGWKPTNPLDTASNLELLDGAATALNEKRFADVFLAADAVKKRQLRLPNAELLRGLAYYLQNKPEAAREAIRAELQFFPNNEKAKEWSEKLSVPTVKTAVAVAPPAGTAVSTPHAFLNPPLEPNNVDLFVVRSTILRAVKEALPHFHGTFLDIGCGVMPYKGLITSAPSRVNKYLGLDLAGSEIYHASVDLRWDGKTIPLGDASVDCAMATEVLEHCPDPIVVLREARRVLKPGGIFFFTVPFVWPLHDAPYDFFRYTPFALEKLLAEAGFTDVKLQAMSGWNASLAQMMGLWLKRSPLTPEARNKWAKQLWPLYQELVNSDQLPADSKAGNTMTTGWTGLAMAPALATPALPEVEPCDLPLVIVRSHEHNYSETFLEDHVKFVSKQTTLLYGYPFPRFVAGGRSVLPEELEKQLQAALAGGGVTAELWRDYTAALTSFFAGCGARVALVETGLMGAFVHDACEQAALPFVVHFHGLDAFGRELLERWQEHYQQFFQTAAQLVVVSEAMRTQLIKLGAPAERVVLAPYGVAVDVAAQAKPAHAGPRFVAVGRFVEKKAPHITLAAFGIVHQKMPAARLTMIGDGPMLAACRDWAAKNGLADAVTFAGVQSREEVSRHMAASGIFVQHSVTAANGDSEGLPLAVLEAGAHGLPVVSTQHAGIPDAVRDAVDGLLVAEKDVKGMALAMLRLAQNPALAAQFGASFRARVGQHYSRKVSIQRLQGILVATTDAGSAEAPSELDLAFAAIAEDRNDRAAYVKFAELRLQDGALADAYCAMGELHRITGGGAATQEVLQTLEGQGVLEHSMVQSYRQRAGWTERRMSEQPQRVLVVTNLLPPQEMGGYGRTMWEFSRELAARGHAVHVLTADMPHLLRQPTAEHEAFEPNVRRALRLFGDWKGGAAVVEPDQAKRNEIARANHQLILAAAKEFRPDVVMVGNLDFIGHFFVQELLNRGVPVLHRLGNASPGFEPAAAPKSPLYCLAGCSEWVNAGLREKGYPFTRYAVLAPGSPLSEYFRAFPPQRKTLRIAFASLLMPYKGAHVLMDALGHLHRAGVAFECTFAGDSTSAEYLEKLKTFAVQQGFMIRLRFPGFLAKAELAALYARCNTLVFPSVFEEPFGKTQIEAMAAGLTVISSGNGGALDIIRDGENGLFFKNNDARDLAEKLAHIHRDPDAAAAIALAGQEDAFRFTTAASVDRLEEILLELVSAAQEIRDAAPERVPAGI